MIKMGLDLHGVIDADPEFFSSFSKQLRERGHEVYVITGREEGEDLITELKAAGMQGVYNKHYDRILSITTYQKQLGTPITYLDDRRSQPMMDPEIWNPTKAMLCASMGIHFMIDDSPIYGEYFRSIKTQYILYTPTTQKLLRFLAFEMGYDLREL